MEGRHRLLSAAAMLVVAGTLVWACTDSNEIARPSIPPPSFAYNYDACISWSCAMGDCQKDPAVYGACCVAMGEIGEGTPRPSCYPPYPSSGSSCGSSYRLDCGSSGTQDDTWYCDISFMCCDQSGNPTQCFNGFEQPDTIPNPSCPTGPTGIPCTYPSIPPGGGA